MRIKTVNSSKATGQLQHAGRQKQGWTPLLPDVEDRFPKEQVLLRKTNCIQFGKAGAHPQLALGIAIAPETLFSHCNLLILMAIAILCDSLLDFCLRFSIRFYLLRKCGLLAHTSPTFLKNCWIKKLLVACGNILGKPPESGSARLGHIPSLPLKSQLPLKPCSMLQPSDFEGNCDFSDFLLDFCYCSLFTLCRGQLAPCTPRRAEPARPHFACGSYLTANSFLQIPC